MMTHDDLGHEGRKDLSEIFRAKGTFSAYYMRDARFAQAKLTEKGGGGQIGGTAAERLTADGIR